MEDKKLALKGATIYTMSGLGIVKEGVILIKNGKIEKVGGKDLEIPEDYEVIDVSGKIITPGLVDAHAHIGLFEEGLRWEGNDGNEMTDPITPHLRVIDGIKPDDPAFEMAREFGITTVGILPGSANPIGGMGAAIKTYGRTVEDMLVKFPMGMKMAFGENPKNVYGVTQKKMPQTRMANAALIREWLYKTKTYIEKKEKAKEDPDKAPEFDIRLEALEAVLKGEIPIRAHAHRASDILTAIRIAEEFGVKIVIEHGTEAYKIADIIAKKGIPVVHGPLLLPRHKPELRNLTIESPVILAKAGVEFALSTDALGQVIFELPIMAAIAVRKGLAPDVALKSMTIVPAKILGIEDRVGSIEEGKDADLVVFSGDPLDIRNKAEMVLINGEIVYSE
ncbi:amidohydrolase [Thermococcus aggregans]|uniref:Amidohydrolase n=1 Tax=Thermococcus aggregans TaxID=110163 RepID=A0A9E7MWI5_THEAG|nr:amidohydrolase [Thermococcus aggregans]USS40056.1 amidohydrolase [Thermococcus aggregans]